MDQSNDLRVYFAAERTLLAWVRTGVTIVGKRATVDPYVRIGRNCTIGPGASITHVKRPTVPGAYVE